MNTLELVVTCLALSLDCFVVMMGRGALMNPQEHRRSPVNSLIFSGCSLAVIILGSLAGTFIKSKFLLHVDQFIAAMILFALGCFLLVQVFRQKHFEERHDNTFTYKKVVILGLVTSADMFLLGTSMTLLAVQPLTVCVVATLITFLVVELGQQIGYRMGMAYRKTFFTIGSVVLLLMSIKIMIEIMMFMR